MKRPWVYLCFFLSGFSGLVNEVVWSRLFVYTMGSTHLSIAVVVSVFMGGLALGSLLGGPIADRSPSPLRLYGWVVCLAGLLAGAVAPLLWLLEPLLGLAYRWHDGEPGHPVFTLVKAVVCAGTILLPTTLMGATLPALARHLTRDVSEVGARLGTLYGVNTFGAVAGAAAAGFYLIGRVGLGWSAAIGAAIDVLVGAAVLLTTRREKAWAPAAPVQGTPSAPGAAGARIPLAVKLAIAAFGVSGFVNMCLQFGWTRTLIISIGNSTYAFSVIVGIFIFGLAAGGWIAGLFTDRLKQPVAAFGWLLVLIATAAGATIPWLGLSPARFAWDLGMLSKKGDLGFASFLAAGAGGVALAILPSTVLMGMTFPLAGRLAALSAPGLAKAVGRAYAANTVGAILGTAVTGFVLMPFLGRIWALLYLAVGLGLLAGLAVLVAAPAPAVARRPFPGRRPAPPRRAVRLAFAGGWLAVLLFLGFWTRPAGVLDRSGERSLWHPAVFAQGAYRTYDSAALFPSHQAYVKAAIRQMQPLYYRDGEAASVAVLEWRGDGYRTLSIAGKTEASAGRHSDDMPTQLLLGHLPLILHSAPRDSLLLGLGGGVSLGAMAMHPEVQTIDLLEISPEVEEAARLYFGEANHRALEDPRVRKVIGDGRNHLAHTSRTYDVICSEPSNFWIAGLGNLFTEEFYRLVLDRLNPGGVVCQWFYCYSIRMEDYQTALRTFLKVFPHATVWTTNHIDSLVLGSREPLHFDRERIAGSLRHTGVREELATLGIAEPEDLFRYFQGERAAVRGWLGEEGPTNRDLFPVLEFSSPLGYFNARPGIQSALIAAVHEELPPALFPSFSSGQLHECRRRNRLGRGLTRVRHQLDEGEMGAALAEYKWMKAEGDAWSLGVVAGEVVKELPKGPQRAEVLRLARDIHDTAELCMADGFRLLAGADLKSQIEVHRGAVRSAPPGRWRPCLALAGMEALARQFSEAEASLEEARKRGAPSYLTSYLRGVSLGMQGNLAAAEESLKESLERAPAGKDYEKGEAAYNLAYCIEQRGRMDDAVAAYRKAIEEDNDPVRAGVAIARCLRRKGDFATAVGEAREALQAAHGEKRESGEARAEIARSLAALGKLAEALQWIETAAKVAPRLYDGELAELRGKARG